MRDCTDKQTTLHSAGMLVAAFTSLGDITYRPDVGDRLTHAKTQRPRTEEARKDVSDGDGINHSLSPAL